MWKRNLTACFAAAVATACAPLAEETTVGERQLRIDEMIAGYQRLYPEVPGANATEVRTALADGGTVLVDVRPAVERGISTIPGAIGKDEFERRAQELRGREIITYCTIGHRSAAYAEELLTDGWNARNFDGSLLAWTHAGGDLVDAAGEPTKRLHVYGARWDLAADGYETVW
jgi:sodium/bile acid cotransporter 7